MGANGLQKVEDLDGEEGISPKDISPEVEKKQMGPVNSDNGSNRTDVYHESNL